MLVTCLSGDKAGGALASDPCPMRVGSLPRRTCNPGGGSPRLPVTSI